MRACECVRACVRTCVCVCVRARACVRACVSVCVVRSCVHVSASAYPHARAYGQLTLTSYQTCVDIGDHSMFRTNHITIYVGPTLLHIVVSH